MQSKKRGGARPGAGRPRTPDSDARVTRQVEKQIDLNATRQREARAQKADIGEIPSCVNPENVSRSRDDFLFFCKHYFPEVFFLEFNDYHKQIAAECGRVVKFGGMQGIAAPRGFCKTAFVRASMAYALLCFPERHKYLIFLGATEEKTHESRIWLYENLCKNPRVFDDFPQVAYPFTRYRDNGRSNVTYKGLPCNARWTGNMLVFPSISGYETSGAAVKFHSINTESLRGQDHIINGIAYRPSIVFIDDPQNVKSAESEARVNNLKNIVFKEVAELAGYDRSTGQKMRMGAIVACTCVAPNDFAMQILDRRQNPDYRGVRIARMITMPKNMRGWERYRDIRNDHTIDHDEAMRLATEFYIKHRTELDEGASTITPNEMEYGQISGIQFAMDKWAKNPQSFWTEQQNDPESAIYAESSSVTPTVVRSKMVVGMNRCQVPADTLCMTAFIDAGKNYHAYEVCAFSENKKWSHTVDYGLWPEQGVAKISKTSYRVGIQSYYELSESETSDDKIFISLIDLLQKITTQKYFSLPYSDISLHETVSLHHERDGHPYHKLAVIGVDCRYVEQTVWKAIAKFTSDNPKWQNRIIPTYGAFAKARTLNQLDIDWDAREWQRGRRFEKNGLSKCHWIENPKKEATEMYLNTGVEYSLKYDANIFKTISAHGWMTGLGLSGCHTMFDHADVRMYAEHQCNEKPMIKNLGGIMYEQWKEVTGCGGNTEFIDTRTGCEALANYIGIESNF